MFTGGCLFIDHASNFVHVENQCHLNTHETIKAKEAFEVMCRDHGVIPQSYLSDNGKAFTSAGFTSHLSQFEQVMKFAGVGAHHHNGNAESNSNNHVNRSYHDAAFSYVADPMLK
jgi:transposase InsO family protein